MQSSWRILGPRNWVHCWPSFGFCNEVHHRPFNQFLSFLCRIRFTILVPARCFFFSLLFFSWQETWKQILQILVACYSAEWTLIISHSEERAEL